MKPHQAHTAAAQELLLSKLSPADQVALGETLDYLQELARRPSGYTPEGSVAAVLNKQSPAVRGAIAAISGVMETPRNRPFQEKWDEHTNAEALGLADPEAAVHIKSALDGQEVMQSLQARLGTDADTPTNDAPITNREALEAAFDFHEGANNG
jgi:hypothetical protein